MQGPHVCDNMCAQLQKDQDPYATDEEYMCAPWSTTILMHSVGIIMNFVTRCVWRAAAEVTPCNLEGIKWLAVLVRDYLDDSTDPENVDVQSCPISPCLRQLRPTIVHAQHLLDEVIRL